MRDVLLKRVRPLVDQLASDLVDLAADRIEAELERVREAIEVALSAYADTGAPDLLTAALGPELASMLTPRPIVERDVKPAKITVDFASRPQRPADPEPEQPTAGKLGGKITCKACGFVGGNARGCGRSHPTLERPPARPEFTAPEEPTARGPVVPPARGHFRSRAKSDPNARPMTAITPERQLKPTPEAVAAAKARIANRSAASTLAAMRTARPLADRVAEPEDDDPEERWSPRRIADETELAERTKRPGSLPAPSSSFRVTPRRGGDIFSGADLGNVEELD